MLILSVIIICYLVQESPVCDLKEHLGSDKAFFLIANDFSEETSLLEKFVFKFGNTECKFFLILVAKAFQKAFNDAKEFNVAVKEGKELVFAPKIEDKSEKKENKEQPKQDN